jgi:hypothetical protein
LLYDHLKGVVNGAILSDGTQVRLPPDVGEHFHASLLPNMDVEVRGYGTKTSYGSVLEAIAIGRRGQPLTHLDASTQQLRCCLLSGRSRTLGALLGGQGLIGGGAKSYGPGDEGIGTTSIGIRWGC